jgi:hypothetical protein
MGSGISRREFIQAGALGAAGVLLGGRALQAQTVAPAATGGDSYTFAVVSDPHLRENREGEPTGVEKFRAMLARIEQQTLLPEIGLPLHVVAGNHENAAHREALRGMFPEDFDGRDYYSFERGDDLFVALCTAIAGDHVGHLQSQQITPQVAQPAWLEETLARRSDFRHVFVFGHVPPEEKCRASTMCLNQAECRWLHGLMARRPATALIFGHRHKQVDFTFAGVPVYGMRSCNWNSAGEPVGGMIFTVEPTGFSARFVPTQA